MAKTSVPEISLQLSLNSWKVQVQKSGGGGGGTEFYLLAGRKQGSAWCLFHASLLLGLTSTLKMEIIVYSSKASSNFRRITWYYIPEHKILHNHPVRNINPTNIV
jgi:hypothetical protein